MASELNPTNGDIDEELRATRNKLRAKIAPGRFSRQPLPGKLPRRTPV